MNHFYLDMAAQALDSVSRMISLDALLMPALDLPEDGQGQEWIASIR